MEKRAMATNTSTETFPKNGFCFLSAIFHSFFRSSHRNPYENKCTIFDFVQLQYSKKLEKTKKKKKQHA